MPDSINIAYEQRNETKCIRMEMAGSVGSEQLNTKIKVSNSTNYTVWCMQATTKAYHLLVNDRRQCKLHNERVSATQNESAQKMQSIVMKT